MILIISLDILAISIVVGMTVTKGFERTLPVVAFLLILFPNESQLRVPGLFDLTTQRLIIITVGMLYVAFGRGSSEGSQKAKLPLKYLIAIQIVWMAVSTANSAVFSVSLKTVLSQMLDYFFVFYLFARAISRVEMVYKILYSLVVAMVICSIFGAAQAYTGWSVISLFPTLPGRFGSPAGSLLDRGIRVQSTFGHPILFGGALAMAIPLALYLIPQAKTSFQKAFLWGGLMLMFLNIYKTGSRGPWLALILSLGVLLILGQGRLRKHLVVIAILTATVLIVRPGVWQTLYSTYTATQDPGSAEGESYQWRYTLYHIAGQELAKDGGRFLWGYGPESFYYLGLTTQFMVDGEMHTVAVESCDSSIAGIMIETGYVGLLITSALLLTPAFFSLRNFRRMPVPANSLCLVLLANMLAFYFLMTNVAIYGWGQQNYLLWIIIALAMIYPRMEAASHSVEGAVQTADEMAACVDF